MWWNKKPDSDAKAEPQPQSKEPSAASSTTPVEQRYDSPRKHTSSAPFDPNKLPDREKLPPALQKIVDKQDKEENFFDELVDG